MLIKQNFKLSENEENLYFALLNMATDYYKMISIKEEDFDKYCFIEFKGELPIVSIKYLKN